MGITDSNSKQATQNDYKLIRRFTSEAYNDLTVVQDKAEHTTWVLKEFIIQSQSVAKLLTMRLSMRHRSLVNLQKYWLQGQESLCSNLCNSFLIYQYFSQNLEDQMQKRCESNLQFGDWQILQIVGDGLDCLKYLQSLGYLHLITSMKSILYDSKTIKVIENIDMVLYSLKNKKINIMGLLSNKKIFPFHPSNQPKQTCETCLDQGQVSHQNIFVLCIIALSLCFLRDPFDLALISKGMYDFRKIKKRISQISKKFPNTHSVLCSLLLATPDHIRYIDALKEISYERRSFKKENRTNSKTISIQPLQKVQKRNKKLSYFRQAKLQLKESNKIQ